MNWILGKWQTDYKENLQYEEWHKISPVKYQGMSYKVNNSDTIISERLMLIIEGENIFYTPTVFNQNNALPIKFKLSKLDKNYVSFENKEHDFPKKIEYFLVSRKKIKASVSNETFSIDFHLSKQKN